jgi:hypothetical protein
MIEKGQTQRVQEAIRAYNDIATNGTTYGAAMQMWRVLNQELAGRQPAIKILSLP